MSGFISIKLYEHRLLRQVASGPRFSDRLRFVSIIGAGMRTEGGGFFWLNTTGNWPLSEDVYLMAGAGG
jgi:hypothetical protein